MARKKEPTAKEAAVKLTPEAAQALTRMAQWSGQSQKTAASRVILWLSERDENTQGAIIHALPVSAQPNFVRYALQQMLTDDDDGDLPGLGEIGEHEDRP